MSRLQQLWNVPGPRSDLERATHVCLTLWCHHLADLDPHVVDMSVFDRRDAVREPTTTLTRVIDDEVTWQLGNHPDAVTMITDDDPTPTVGELVAQIAFYTVLLETWRPVHGHPISEDFLALGHLYDSVITGLNTGHARQHRRHATGTPPIARPARIRLIATDKGPAVITW
ncbi:hypothetical protein [Nocardia bovistercoris]|uniref:Uncharacterized protein n=1 Tax=Nocardia bovistercoris TaxID=2785916 RepID=A0A931N0V8_9NOCA|nr:hypothetical protein [Nocardia bovistercoris]MBH0777710.1 hypothetical protein [Nocardia bovistercoris]